MNVTSTAITKGVIRPKYGKLGNQFSENGRSYIGVASTKRTLS